MDVRVVDMAAREHKSEAFLQARRRRRRAERAGFVRRAALTAAAAQVNPFGKLPALSDGSMTHVVRTAATSPLVARHGSG